MFDYVMAMAKQRVGIDISETEKAEALLNYYGLHGEDGVKEAAQTLGYNEDQATVIYDAVRNHPTVDGYERTQMNAAHLSSEFITRFCDNGGHAAVQARMHVLSDVTLACARLRSHLNFVDKALGTEEHVRLRGLSAENQIRELAKRAPYQHAGVSAYPALMEALQGQDRNAAEFATMVIRSLAQTGNFNEDQSIELFRYTYTHKDLEAAMPRITTPLWLVIANSLSEEAARVVTNEFFPHMDSYT